MLTTSDETLLEELSKNCASILTEKADFEIRFDKLEKLKTCLTEKQSMIFGMSQKDIDEFIDDFSTLETELTSFCNKKLQTLAMYTSLSTRIAELVIERVSSQKKLDSLVITMNHNQDEFQKLSVLGEQDCLNKKINAFGEYIERADGVLKNVLPTLVECPKGNLEGMASEMKLVKPRYVIKSSTVISESLIEYITISICLCVIHFALEITFEAYRLNFTGF